MKAGDGAIKEKYAGWKARNGYDHELASKIAGFSSYATLRRRMEAPETMTLKELRKLAEVTRATDAEILRMVTGRRTR